MTAWSRREREAAKALGGVRVVRHRGQRAPDVAPITLPTGEVLQPEVKHRKRLPRLLAAALTQALGYTPGAVPVAVVSEHRGTALAVLRLADFARLVGVELNVPEKPRRRRTPKRWAQVSLFTPDGAAVHKVDVRAAALSPDASNESTMEEPCL